MSEGRVEKEEVGGGDYVCMVRGGEPAEGVDTGSCLDEQAGRAGAAVEDWHDARWRRFGAAAAQEAFQPNGNLRRTSFKGIARRKDCI